MKFDNNLYRLRKRNGFSQAQVAEKIGVTQSVYAKYELNKINPKEEVWEKISDFYCVPVKYAKGEPTEITPYNNSDDIVIPVFDGDTVDKKISFNFGELNEQTFDLLNDEKNSYFIYKAKHLKDEMSLRYIASQNEKESENFYKILRFNYLYKHLKFLNQVYSKEKISQNIYLFEEIDEDLKNIINKIDKLENGLKKESQWLFEAIFDIIGVKQAVIVSGLVR